MRDSGRAERLAGIEPTCVCFEVGDASERGFQTAGRFPVRHRARVRRRSARPILQGSPYSIAPTGVVIDESDATCA